ncbi:MAG: hypothetical protein V2A62_04000 [Candidatus Woesearchaeota archaeon]
MYIPKRYGESKIEECPFCGRQSTLKNQQDISVCAKHKDALLNEMKCICGEYLETCSGKWGLYFRCQKCGNVNKKKIFEINQVKDVSKIDFDKEENKTESGTVKKQQKKIYSEPKEITITSRDTDWCD